MGRSCSRCPRVGLTRFEDIPDDDHDHAVPVEWHARAGSEYFGARVADIGSGYGASTIVMAQVYPSSTFVGLDYHAESIDVARARAREAGVADRVRFEAAVAADFPGEGYDVACVFDALHDMGDPVGAAGHIRDALTPDGTFLLVEPMAGETLAENTNVVGRLFYSAGMFIASGMPSRRVASSSLVPRCPSRHGDSCSAKRASPGSVVQRRRRSTGCSKPDRRRRLPTTGRRARRRRSGARSSPRPGRPCGACPTRRRSTRPASG